MDVRVENRGRPHQKRRFPAAPVAWRNFLTPGHPGVRVRNVCGKSRPKSLCLCCFFFPDQVLQYEIQWQFLEALPSSAAALRPGRCLQDDSEAKRVAEEPETQHDPTMGS